MENEKNRITLKLALRAMKGYTAPDAVWDNIKLDLDQSKKDVVLHDAISNSDGLDPPESIWDNISFELEQETADQPLQEAISNLKGYEPADQVWNGIDSALRPNTGKIRRMKFMKQVVSIAAIGLIAWLSLPYWSSNDLDKESITFSEETVVSTNNNAMVWDEDEHDFQMVAEWCKTGNIACTLPEFKSLKSEMDDLNDAKVALTEVISDFETDDSLIAQLKNIEIERGNVLKQMISLM